MTLVEDSEFFKPRDKARFMQYVSINQETGCWNWIGATKPNGYGAFGLERGYKSTQAHRAAYFLFVGKIPEGMLVLHKCDVKSCVNPGHLWLGTQAQNMQDSVDKGRTQYHGGGNPNATLTETDVLSIRARANSHSRIELAAEYGVTRATIGYIINRKTWINV